MSCHFWQEVKENKVEISSVPLCLDPHVRKLKVFLLCCKSMSKGIERRFNETKLLRNKGKGKEVRMPGKREMPAIERQGGKGQSEVSFGRIESVRVPPNGNKEESKEPGRHSEAPF